MAARGIKVNHDGTTLAYASWQSNDFCNAATTDLVICGWVRIKGNASATAGGYGHTMFAIPRDATNMDNSDHFDLQCSDAALGTPYTYKGMVTNNSTYNESTLTTTQASPSEDWFYCLAWDGTGHNGVWYYGIDGAGSLTSATAGSGLTINGPFDGIFLCGVPAASTYGSNIEVTNIKVWIGGTVYADFTASSGAWIYDEMNSEAAVHTTSLFAHWKLASAADTTDYSGNSRTLTMTGTVQDGTMDPQDIISVNTMPRAILLSGHT